MSGGYELLVLLMQGAYVNTEMDQRLCMLGCASRQLTAFGNYTDNYTVSTENDCNFLVKVRESVWQAVDI